jgi:hypothetical protein
MTSSSVAPALAILRAARAMPLAARRDLVARLQADLDLIDGMAIRAAWLSFRLRASRRAR